MEVATHYPLVFVGVDCYFAEVRIVLTVKAKDYKLQDPHKRMDLCGSLWISVRPQYVKKHVSQAGGFAFLKIHLEQLAAHQPDQKIPGVKRWKTAWSDSKKEWCCEEPKSHIFVCILVQQDKQPAELES